VLFVRFLKINLTPARFLAAGFALMIALGSLLLSLPFASTAGKVSFVDALFTATSAVCVTGLAVKDTGTFYTVFGQFVIMFLILGGALGFMTTATLIFVLLGKKITLKDRLMIKEALNTDSIQGLVHLIIIIARMAALTILLGSLLLGFRFLPQYGWKKGLLFSFFHAISAFGNCGFDLFGNFQSLTSYASDYLVSGTISALFIFGGLGFTVVLDLLQRKKAARYALHSRLVLFFTAFLLIFGTLFIFCLEGNNSATLGGLPLGSKVFQAFFTAATPRTAGFNVVPTDSLYPGTLFFIIILMFIGASPASTGGGIKTTTFILIIGTVRALLMGSDEVVFGGKRIPPSLILKAFTITVISISLIFIIIFALTIVEEQPFLDLTFEVFSAFGTVGLSTGVTPYLSTTGKLLLIITMYAGRIGPLTLLYALTRKFKPSGIRYPEEKILIG
jgi:trk system potassium uptake protein TrkH